MSKKQIEVGTVRPQLSVTKHEDCIPMVGWHQSWATLTESNGKEWELQIVGGCCAIWLNAKDNPGVYFSVEISDIAEVILQFLNEVKP